ncbi:hypothetical protein [Nocardia lijiangensis]|uniref:hypothetical protein n=1 Tax=Nocardia lijiangensis TaxID=299618 RepID=UPI00082AC01C|nr:hypothetical protein [Nocardia lijiangensis]
MFAIPPSEPTADRSAGDPPPPPPISPQVLLVLGAFGGWALTTLTDPAAAIDLLTALIAIIPADRVR